MRTLLLKDLLFQKPNLVIGGLYSLIFFLAFGVLSSSPEGGFTYIISGIAVGYMILLGSFGADKNDTPRFLLSLPVTRRDAVNGKFALLLLATAYGTAAASLIGALMTIPAFGFDVRWITPTDLLAIAAGMLLPSVLIPLYFRFGHRAVRYALMGALVLILVVQVVGVIVFTLSDNVAGVFVVFDWILNVARSVEPLQRNLMLTAIGAVVASSSYVASRAIYARQEV